MGGKRRRNGSGEAELTRGRFELGDDRKSVRYRFRGEPGKGVAHEVDAIEATEADTESGDVGAVGDFIVVREGFEPQWWTRDAFLDQYEAV